MAKKSSTGSAKKKNRNNTNKLRSVLKPGGPVKSKDNPFESIWSRHKFNILGKRRKDEERRHIGLSRSLDIQKRRKTLLKEYEQSTKSSVFVDKRIGERNEGLGEFDKAILRSQRERQLKLKKKSKYNLSDGEEDDFDIQDGGFLPERDDFEDEEPLDEDEGRESVGSSRSLALGGFNSSGAEDGPGSESPEGQENGSGSGTFSTPPATVQPQTAEFIKQAAEVIKDLRSENQALKKEMRRVLQLYEQYMRRRNVPGDTSTPPIPPPDSRDDQNNDM